MILHKRHATAGPNPGATRSGFTLAEVAVTLVIVAMTLLLVMEGLNNSRMTSAQARNRKVALELALLTVSQVESGFFWEDFDGVATNLSGTYAEDGYSAFYWELTVGDEELPDAYDDDKAYFDNYAHRRDREQQSDDYEDEQEAYAETGSSGGPFERVTVRVTYPKLTDRPNTLTLERWIPLEQVFGQDEDAEASDESESS